MTIFDSLNFPIHTENWPKIWPILPKEIRNYWIHFHHTEPTSTEDRIKLLQMLIYEYNTEVCRIRKCYDNF